MKSTARIFYGLGIIGIGILHFIYPGFRPFILPVPAEATKDLSILVYLAGTLLVIAGVLIIVLKNSRIIALSLGIFFLLFFAFGHLPNRLTNHPELLGYWTDALKILAFAGGAFMLANLSFGKYLFALLLVIFGIDHFLYVDFVKPLVPEWIPGKLFWTYAGGTLLFCSGLAIFINFKPKLIGILLGAMLFTWLIILHVPRAVAAPPTDNGNELTSVFQALAFSGMALWYAATSKRNGY